MPFADEASGICQPRAAPAVGLGQSSWLCFGLFGPVGVGMARCEIAVEDGVQKVRGSEGDEGDSPGMLRSPAGPVPPTGLHGNLADY